MAFFVTISLLPGCSDSYDDLPVAETDDVAWLVEYSRMHGVMNRSMAREHYPNLTDAEFANFREIRTTGMARSNLYRSSSPVDPALGRNRYADSLAKVAHVATIINMSNSKYDVDQFKGFKKTYYASCNYLCLLMPMDFMSDDFRSKLLWGLRYMIEQRGPYLLHCQEGKDRTGFVAAVLEALMGASLDEILADYIKSFTNFYNAPNRVQIPLTQEETNWFKNRFLEILELNFSRENLADANLSEVAQDYLQNLGLVQIEIDALKERLSGK